jgi:hypothetical protein
MLAGFWDGLVSVLAWPDLGWDLLFLADFGWDWLGSGLGWACLGWVWTGWMLCAALDSAVGLSRLWAWGWAWLLAGLWVWIGWVPGWSLDWAVG